MKFGINIQNTQSLCVFLRHTVVKIKLISGCTSLLHAGDAIVTQDILRCYLC